MSNEFVYCTVSISNLKSIRVLVGVLVLLTTYCTDSCSQLTVLGLRRRNYGDTTSHPIDLPNANPACGHKEVRRSTGHIMVAAHYSNDRDPNRDKSLARSNQPRTSELIGVKTMSWVRITSQYSVLLSGVLQVPVFQNLSKPCAPLSAFLFFCFNRDPNRDKSLARSNQPRTSETCRCQDDVFGYELPVSTEFLLSGVLQIPIFQNLS